jgi:hypothetical protein
VKKRKIDNVTVENNEIEKHKNDSQQQCIGYCKIQNKHEILNKEYLCSDVIISAQNLIIIQFPEINGFQETALAPVKSNGKWVSLSHNGFLPQDPPSVQIHNNGNQHWVLSTLGIVNIGYCQHWVLSTLGIVNIGYCQHWVLSTQLSNGEIYLLDSLALNITTSLEYQFGTNLWQKS